MLAHIGRELCSTGLLARVDANLQSFLGPGIDYSITADMWEYISWSLTFFCLFTVLATISRRGHGIG